MPVSRRNSDGCLRSLCIYCPSLSGGREECAMDNILFFYPAHLHADLQMNHVGFCIGVSCLVERFNAPVPVAADAGGGGGASSSILPPSSSETVEEIRMKHATIALFRPFADLWIVVEVAPAYDSSAVLPVVRRGFEAFVLRYGWSTVEALVRPLDGVADSVIHARVALDKFYEKFALFLETRVLLLGIQHAEQTSPGIAPPLPALSSSAVGGMNSRRWRRRWTAVAAAESLLGFPVFMRAETRAVQLMCHSLARRHLSLLSPSNSPDDGGGGGGKAEKNFVRGWGQEHLSVAVTPSVATLAKSAEEQLLWTRFRYVVLIAETLKVIASNTPKDVISQLVLLLLVESEVTQFTAFVGGGRLRCHVCHEPGVIVALLIDESIYRLVQKFVPATCSALADDIVRFLTHSSRSLTSKSHNGVNSNDMQQLVQSSLNPSHHATAAFFAAPPISEFPKLHSTKLTFQWSVWHRAMLAGSPMREYPRAVRVLMSSMMRRLIRGLHDADDRVCICSSGSDMRCTVQWESGKIEATPLCVDAPETQMEVWAPLCSTTWVCVTQKHRRVGGMAFYNNAPLRSCFGAVAELQRNMLLVL